MLKYFKQMYLSVKHNRATKGQRAFNFIIDFIVLNIIVFIICYVLYNFDLAYETIYKPFYLYFIYFAYYVITESLLSKTLAKFITKTKLVTYENTKPDFLTVIARSLARLIPFDPLSFFGNIGWHDSLSKTTVISDV